MRHRRPDLGRAGGLAGTATRAGLLREPRLSPRIVFYGDDFTGASDTLATASRAGLRTLLFLGVPDDRRLARAGPLDVVGIAGASRSMAPDAMRAELAPVRAVARRLGAPILHYKVCSTFDSAPAIGSIGVAVEALTREDPVGDRPRPAPKRPVLIVGGQPNLGRYCLFGHLFASVDAGGDVFRIDRHATMRHHPVTPMDEADLRLHLSQQGLEPVASVDYTRYALAPAALDRLVDARLAPTSAGPTAAVLFDVGDDDHLAVVGRQLARLAATGSAAPVVAIGPSGVTQALIAHWRSDAGEDGATLAADPAPRAVAPAAGPVFVLAGSLSGVTARQRERAVSYAPVRIDPQRLVGGGPEAVRADIDDIVRLLGAGRHVLAHMSPTDTDRAHRADPDLARASGALLRSLLTRVLPGRGRLSRIGVAGGDTSSHAVRALDVWALAYVGQVAAGVALCSARSDDPTLDGIELMLKGGQMGGPDIFERLLGS